MDREWISLIAEAKAIGITKDQVRNFLEQNRAIAVKDREGYFSVGDKIRVKHISGSVYRAYGTDSEGYPWSCLITNDKFKR